MLAKGRHGSDKVNRPRSSGGGGGGGRLWGSPTVASKASPFFEGPNLIHHLTHSSFGSFMDSMDEIFKLAAPEVDRASFRLPRVVVVGTESAGKSSLLENLTKVAIFPRDAKICTKRPLRLCLSEPSGVAGEKPVTVTYLKETWQLEREEVLEKIKTLMDGIQGDDIGEDEIVVHIRGKGFPTFELIDLPGIREFPAELRERSRDLVTSYISDPDTLVLAVVPAITTRLTANQGIGMVIEKGKQAKTIIALTMTDQVQRINMSSMVVDRLLGETDELKGHKFGGVVAVINRLHHDEESLAEASDREGAWFRELFNQAPAEYRCHLKTLRERVTVDHVIRLLDTLFHAHIRHEWKPRMLTSLQPLIREREDEITALGIHPDKLRVQNVVKAAINLVTLDGTHLAACLPFTKTLPGFAYGSDERRRYSSMIAQQDELLTKMPDFIGKMAPKAVRGLVMAGLRPVFKDPQGRSPHALRFERFTALHDSLSKCIDRYLAPDSETFKRFAVVLRSRIESAALPNPMCQMVALTEHLTCAMLCEAHRVLLALPSLVDAENGHALLQESKPYAATRARLAKEVDSLKACHKQIDKIDGQMAKHKLQRRQQQQQQQQQQQGGGGGAMVPVKQEEGVARKRGRSEGAGAGPVAKRSLSCKP